MKLLQKIKQPLLIVATILMGVVAIKAFFMPLQVTEDRYRGEKIQQINYDYLVYTRPSILYPEGTKPLPPGNSGYPINIVDKIEFFVEGKLAAPVSHDIEGKLAITLLLRSEGQWQKELDIKPDVKEAATINGKEFRASFNLPIREALGLAEKVVQEIGLSPNSGYKLIVQSTFTSLSEAVAEEALSASYEFELWQGMIEPLGEELAFSNREEVVETVTAAKLFSFFGYNISVVSARIIFSVLFLLFLTLLIYQQMKAKKNSSGVINPVAAEVRRIRKKYGNRIIEIADLKEIPAGYLQVQLYSFKDLLKLAEEREHPILQISSVDFKTSCFYTVDDNTLYVYRINLG